MKHVKWLAPLTLAAALSSAQAQTWTKLNTGIARSVSPNQIGVDIGTSAATFVQFASVVGGSISIIPPSASTRGGLKSSSAPANQFARGVDTNGDILYARPDASNVTFLQSGTGAVSRDLLVKGKEIVSVTDFGALCNSNGTHGNGNDDTSAIQAAINYAGPLGAEVVFPRGVCRTTATLNASTTNNVYRLKGAGYASQIFNDSTSPTATITANASSYSGGSCPISIMPCVSVEGLTFLPPNATGAGNSVLAGTANQHIRFVGNTVQGYRVGVILATSYGPEIIGNTFSNVLSNAIYLAADSTGNHAYIANNRLFANGLTTNDAAIFVGGTVSAATVISNDLESNYIGVQFGAVTGLTFVGNFIEMSTSANLYFTTTATGVILTGNTFNSGIATTLDISKSLIAANFGASWTVTWSAGSTGNLFHSNPAGWATPPSSVAIDATGGLTAPNLTASGTISGAALVTGAPTTKTANYTVDSGASKDSSVIFNGSGSLTITLPSAASNSGRLIRLKTIAAQTVVSASSNVVPLAGGAAGTAILAATAGKYAMLQSDGTNWIVMEAN